MGRLFRTATVRRAGAWLAEAAMLRFVGFAILCACTSTSGSNTPSTRQVRVDPTDPWLGFVDEYCGRWAAANRAHAPSYIAFYERTQTLSAGAVSDYPFRVLGDITLVECWRTVSEVVGFVGTETDVERLMLVLEQFRPGSLTLTDWREVEAISSLQSEARRGLGIAAARFGESHPLTERLVEHLRMCSETSYWRVAGRIPRSRSEWYSPDVSLDDLEASTWLDSATMCVAGLGNTGFPRAATILAAYREAASGRVEWRRKISRFESALTRNALMRQMGLDRFVRAGFGGDL